MLLLDSRSLTIEGVTVFRDHADPSQFWYLPAPVTLARRPSDQRKAFTFLKYKRAAGLATRGGGFLMFEVTLRLDTDTERRITERLGSISRGQPRLTAVPFDDGTVACVALNLQGAGGTRTPAAVPGAFNAVETILGASRPSLAGDNSAAFSLELSAEGATILEKAFREKTTPIGVIYDLKYTGLRPAFNVKIIADFKQIFTHFGSAAEGQRGFLRAGIDAGFETLLRNGAIRIEVADMTGTPENETRIKEALDFFKAQVLNTWFNSALVPGTLAAGMSAAASLDQVRTLGEQLRPPQPPAPPKPDPSKAVAEPSDHGPSPTAGTGKGDSASGLAPASVEQGATTKDSPTTGTGNPALAAPAPASGAADISPRPDNAVAATADPPNAAEGMVAAFKLKSIRQEERRTATFEYNRAEAQQRSYAPQGFLGILASDLARPPYFVEIDLDDPFFRSIHVETKVPVDFPAIGLSEVHLALDYGPPADPENHRHQDFVFTAEDRGPKSVDFMVNLRKDQVYAMTTQYHFNPSSDWDGEKFTYEQPSVTTADRTLLLNPMEALGFLQVKVEPGRIDTDVVDFIDVDLSYTDPSGWSRTKTFRVTGGNPATTWKLRVSRDSPRDFTYQLTHHLKAGSIREDPPVTTNATTVLVNDPFPGVLEVTVFPILDFARIRAAMLDVHYEDPANRYTRRQRVRLTPELTETVVRFSILNPTLKRYRHELTIVRSDGTTEQRTVETEENILSIIG